MVRPSLFLDARRPSSAQAAVQASAQAASATAPSWVLGRVLATPAQEPDLPAGWVRVGIPHDNPVSEATGLTDGGLTALGAVVLVTLDPTGHVVSISSPITLPDGAQAVPTGALGSRLQETAQEVAQTREHVQTTIDEAQKALSEVREQTGRVEKGLTAAQERAEQIAQEGERLRSQVTDQARKVGALEGSVTGLRTQVTDAGKAAAGAERTAQAAQKAAAQASQDAAQASQTAAAKAAQAQAAAQAYADSKARAAQAAAIAAASGDAQAKADAARAAAEATARKAAADAAAQAQAAAEAKAADARRAADASQVAADTARAQAAQAKTTAEAASRLADGAGTKADKAQAAATAASSAASSAQASASEAAAKALAAQAQADALRAGLREWWPNPLFDPSLPALGARSSEVPPVGKACLADRRDHFGGNSSEFWHPVAPGMMIDVEVTAKRVRGSQPLRLGLNVRNAPEQYTVQAFVDALGSPQVTDLGGGWGRYTGRTVVPAGDYRYGRVWLAIDQPATGGGTAWLVSDLRVREGAPMSGSLFGEWPQDWGTGARITKRDTYLETSNSSTVANSGLDLFGSLFVVFPRDTRRVLRVTATVSASAGKGGLFTTGAHILQGRAWKRSVWPAGGEVSIPAEGWVRHRYVLDIPVTLTGVEDCVRIITYVPAAGRTVTVHRVDVEDVTEQVAAQRAADAAAQRAVEARQVADAASAKALGAQAAADAASARASTADGRYTVSASDPAPKDGSGRPSGAVWEVRAGTTALRRFVWDGKTWTQVKIGADYVGDKAIGRAQVADAAIGTAQVADASITNAKVGWLSAEKLRAAVGHLDVGFIKSLLADTGFIRRLYTERIAVAAATLFPDPRLEDVDGWHLDTGVTIIQVPGVLGNVLNIPAAKKQYGAYYQPPGRVDASLSLRPGQSYRVSMMVRFPGFGGSAPASMYLRYHKGDKIVISRIVRITDVLRGAPKEWTRMVTQFTFPAEATQDVCALSVHAESTFTSGSIQATDIRVEETVGTTLIEPGSITTPLLRVTSDLWTRLLTVAGDATIGGRLLVNDSVTASKINVTEELAARIGRFLRVTTDMLTAGKATIAGTAVVGEIVGNLIRGATIRSGDDRNGLKLDHMLQVFRNGTLTNRISHDRGVEVLDTRTNSLVSLSAMLFGNRMVQWTGSWWVQGPATVSEWYGPWVWKEVMRFRATTSSLAILWHCRTQFHREWHQTGYFPLYGGASIRKPGGSEYTYLGPYPNGDALAGSGSIGDVENIPSADIYTANFGFTQNLKVGQEYVLELWFRHGNANFTEPDGTNRFYPKYTTDITLIDMITWAL